MAFTIVVSGRTPGCGGRFNVRLDTEAESPIETT